MSKKLLDFAYCAIRICCSHRENLIFNVNIVNFFHASRSVSSFEFPRQKCRFSFAKLLFEMPKSFNFRIHFLLFLEIGLTFYDLLFNRVIENWFSRMGNQLLLLTNFSPCPTRLSFKLMTSLIAVKVKKCF